MKPKGRYNIKLAEKKGIEVALLKKTEENIKAFYDLMVETTTRDAFSGNTLDYYSNFLNEIEGAELIGASKGSFLLAAGIFIFDKNTSIYYYGASTSQKEYRNLMAPYLLQWFAIKHAQSKKSKLYDFL